MPHATSSIFLANHAEVVNGLVYANGMGWDTIESPISAFALIMITEVPWDLTNQPLELVITLADEDGGQPHIAHDEDGNPVPVTIASTVEVGRPAGLKPGTSVTASQVVLFGPGIPLEPGRYEWRLSIDGTESLTRTFTVK